MTFVEANPDGWTDGVDGPTPKQLHHMQANMGLALDGAGGGRYTPIGPISITDGAGGALGDVDVHGRLWAASGNAQPRIAFKPGTLPAINNQTIGIASGGQILRFIDLGVVAQHQMDNAGATAGDWILFISASPTAKVAIYKAGAAPGYVAGDLIVTLNTASHGCAKLCFDGADWRLAEHSPGTIAGAFA